MKQRLKILKHFVCFSISILCTFSNFAAVVSDNDGSTFITKAEFDSLKNNFQSQIDSFNISIDNKIDAAIASYLAGVRLSGVQDLEVTWIKQFPNVKKISDKNQRLRYIKRDIHIVEFAAADAGGNSIEISNWTNGWTSDYGIGIYQYVRNYSLHGHKKSGSSVLRDSSGYFDSKRNMKLDWTWINAILGWYSSNMNGQNQTRRSAFYTVLHGDRAPADWNFDENKTYQFLSGQRCHSYTSSYTNSYAMAGQLGDDVLAQVYQMENSYDIVVPDIASNLILPSAYSGHYRMDEECYMVQQKRKYESASVPSSDGPNTDEEALTNHKWSTFADERNWKNDVPNKMFDGAISTSGTASKAFVSVGRGGNSSATSTWPSKGILERDNISIPRLIFRDTYTLNLNDSSVMYKSKRTKDLFGIDADIRVGVCLFKVPKAGKVKLTIKFVNTTGIKTAYKPHIYLGKGNETKFSDYREVNIKYLGATPNLTVGNEYVLDSFDANKEEYIFLNWDEEFDTSINDFGMSLSKCIGELTVSE